MQRPDVWVGRRMSWAYWSEFDVSTGNRQYTMCFHICTHSHLSDVGCSQSRTSGTDSYRSHCGLFAWIAKIKHSMALRLRQWVSIYRLEPSPLISRLHNCDGHKRSYRSQGYMLRCKERRLMLSTRCLLQCNSG